MASRTSLMSRVLAFATGAGVAAGLLGATVAQAAQYQVGEFEIFLDTTISVGASLRTAERESRYLPSGNGGPQDTRPLLTGLLCDTLTFAATSGMTCAPMAFGGVFDPFTGFATTTVPDTDFKDNFDGSINTDDGRLNWDQGDLIAGAARVIHDVEVNWQNFTFFTRFNYFYDAVLDDESSAERSPLSEDVRNDIGRGFNVLDAYLSVDFDIPNTGIPINLRQGYQVISWGESTFIQNGINIISPIDANAFRSPSSELREAFVPVHATYLQATLPYNLSVEAFYQWEWEAFKVDPGGSPFSGSDVIRPFSSGGSGGTSFIGGSQSAGTFRRNCDFGAPSTVGVLNAIGLGLGAIGAPDPALIPDCANPAVDFRYDIPIGMNEAVRIANDDRNIMLRTADRDADDGGEYGFAVRYYADWLNATEFGAYYVNYHSRLPLASIQPSGNAPRVHISTIGASAGALTRQVLPVGCLTDAALGLASIDADFLESVGAHPNTFAGVGFIGGGNFPLYALTPAGGTTYENLLGAYSITGANDPNGLMAALAPIAEAILFATGTTSFATAGGQVALAPGAFVAAPDSMLKIMQINCALAAVQSGIVDFSFDPGAEGGLSSLAPQLATGAEFLGFTAQHQIFLEYPEDIRMFGISFNTTIGTWGVQGEVTYRDNQPLQLDTDMLTITSALQQCAFPAGTGDLGFIFESLGNAVSAGATGNCNPAQQFTGLPRAQDGYVREEVFTGQVGTTATYTASNPLIGWLGADLGIFVTEVGFVYVPDVPDEGDFSVLQLASNGCQGSDLPLGGLLALDGRRGCRVTDFSYGYVLLGRLDYNNVMGAFTVSPLVAFSHNVEGYTPSPLGNYMEDRMSATFQLGASYQNTWRASVGYNTFFGAGIRNKASDRDFASVNLSYSF